MGDDMKRFGALFLVLGMLAVDLGVFNRQAHVVTMKEAGRWTAIVVFCAAIFNVIIFYSRGSEAGLQFLTGYLIELALSVAGDGLDSLELERRLATLLLHRLEAAERAAELFAHLLKNAPGDQAAMASLRACQAARGDWDGYTKSLVEELRVLLGRTLSGHEVPPDWVDALDPGEVPRPLRSAAAQILCDLARTRQEQLEDEIGAHRLWGKALALWPENVDALERRIALDRKLDDDGALAADLERYASMLLDANARFDVLFEAAQLCAGLGADLGKARALFDEALQAAAELSQPPAGVEDAREALRALEKG